jgi:hypothetical protein
MMRDEILSVSQHSNRLRSCPSPACYPINKEVKLTGLETGYSPPPAICIKVF